MIRPTKHIDLSNSVLNVSSVIYFHLQHEKTEKYESLLQATVSKLGEPSRYQFSYALGFLYVLGKIDYDVDSDCFLLLENIGDEIET